MTVLLTLLVVRQEGRLAHLYT